MRGYILTLFPICCNMRSQWKKNIFFSILIMYILRLPELNKLYQLAEQREWFISWPLVLHYQAAWSYFKGRSFWFVTAGTPALFSWNGLEFRTLIKHILGMGHLCGTKAKMLDDLLIRHSLKFLSLTLLLGRLVVAWPPKGCWDNIISQMSASEIIVISLFQLI